MGRAAQRALRDRRVLIGVAAALIAGGAAFNWGWLVAVGVAPLLLSLAPCLIMCGLGLCMTRSCSKHEQAANGATLSPRQILSASPAAAVTNSSRACCGAPVGDEAPSRP
nr:hypothetical protein [Propylenella binzhouense]